MDNVDTLFERLFVKSLLFDNFSGSFRVYFNLEISLEKLLKLFFAYDFYVLVTRPQLRQLDDVDIGISQVRLQDVYDVDSQIEQFLIVLFQDISQDNIVGVLFDVVYDLLGDRLVLLGDTQVKGAILHAIFKEKVLSVIF
jgi:hypothetical protein